MMNVKVLGGGCSKCETLLANAKEAIEVMHGLISGDDRLERYGIINNIFMKDKVGVK